MTPDRARILSALYGLATVTLAASPAAAGPGDTIRVSVTPCSGACPSYTVAVKPGGLVAFDGEQHTAVRGKRERQAGRVAYRRVARALAPYRPAPGATATTRCEQQVSDQQGYRISWTDRNGGETVLTHDRGCLSRRGAALNRVMEGLPATLGIGDWIRPGAGMGRGIR